MQTRRGFTHRWATLVAGIAMLLSGLRPAAGQTSVADIGGGAPRRQAPSNRPAPARLGTQFTDPPLAPRQAPTFHRVPLPAFPHGIAIWGATGRDDNGLTYVGVSCTAGPNSSGHLFRIDPRTGQTVRLGDVVSQLKKAGLYHAGETQSKIHSKICPADDGMLYFASLDERGENEDGSALPPWGGHLWRIRPETGDWEHLLATREALIAVATTGRYVYALGYFRHVVYQYDTRTGAVKSATVGSMGGHISRNLLVDLNEHVYVPRVEEAPTGSLADPSVSLVRGVRVRSSLVEYDTEMRELQSVPLADYEPSFDADSHGIVGFAPLRSGALVFTTHTGAFWRISPSAQARARIERLGWFHPRGRAYAASLYSPAGERYVCGVAQVPKGEFEWIVYDLDYDRSTTCPVDHASRLLLARPGLLLYGSTTRDERGDGYVGGWAHGAGGLEPCLLRIRWPRGDEGGAGASGNVPRYRLSERYGAGAPGEPRGAITAYRAAFHETLRVTSSTANEAAPAIEAFQRRAVWKERLARPDRRDDTVALPVIRQYEAASQAPVAMAGAGAPFVQGLSLWVQPRIGEPAQILALNNDRALRFEEYRFLTQQPNVPELAGLLPGAAVRVGDSWEIRRMAAQSLIAGGIRGPGSLVATLTEVRPDQRGTNRATIRLAGQIPTLVGNATVNAQIEFTFEDPPAPLFTPDDGPMLPTEAIGAIQEIRLAQVNAEVRANTAESQTHNLHRELVFQRRLRFEGAPPELPAADPRPTAANSWLLFTDPKRRFTLRFQQAFLPANDSATGDVLVLRRPRGGSIDELRLAYTAQAAPDAARFLTQLEDRWAKARIRVPVGLAAQRLPAPDWPGATVEIVEADLQLPGSENVGPVHATFCGYIVRWPDGSGLTAEATTEAGSARAARAEVEAVARSFRLTGPAGGPAPVISAGPVPR